MPLPRSGKDLDDRCRASDLGLGPMGQALAGAFLQNAHPTTVWNRTAAKADALVALGARRADSVADAVAAGPLVIVCVIDYDAVDAIVSPTVDALNERTLVNLTADSPDRARQTAAWAAHGMTSACSAPAAAIARRAIDAGHGTDNFSRLVQVLGKAAPPQ